MNVIAIPPEDVDHVWEQVAPLIEKAADFDYHGLSIEEHHDRIASGHYLLILIADGSEILAAIDAELATVNGEPVCNIIAAGGHRLNEWQGIFLDSLFGIGYAHLMKHGYGFF